jgi:hypothetical protein
MLDLEVYLTNSLSTRPKPSPQATPSTQASLLVERIKTSGSRLKKRENMPPVQNATSAERNDFFPNWSPLILRMHMQLASTKNKASYSASCQSQNITHREPITNAIVLQGSTIIKLRSITDQSLLVRWSAFAILNHAFHLIYSRLLSGVDGEGSARQRLHVDEEVWVSKTSGSWGTHGLTGSRCKWIGQEERIVDGFQNSQTLLAMLCLQITSSRWSVVKGKA